VCSSDLLRPFVEGRLGYRYTEVLAPFAEGGHVDLATLGASAGLELLLNERVSFYASGGWDGAFGNGFQEQGPMATFGMAFRF
jgi:hypothetical protein